MSQWPNNIWKHLKKKIMPKPFMSKLLKIEWEFLLSQNLKNKQRELNCRSINLYCVSFLSLVQNIPKILLRIRKLPPRSGTTVTITTPSLGSPTKQGTRTPLAPTPRRLGKYLHWYLSFEKKKYLNWKTN